MNIESFENSNFALADTYKKRGDTNPTLTYRMIIFQVIIVQDDSI